MLLEDEFCDIIKKARFGQGLSLELVAQQAGLSAHDLQSLERGQRLPTSEDVYALGEILGLRPGPLLDIARQNWAPPSPPAWVHQYVITILGDIGGYAVKGYLLFDYAAREALMIDTAYNPEQMGRMLREHNLRLIAICLTHGHADHAGGLDRIVKDWSVPVYLGAADRHLLPWQPPQEQLVDLQDRQTLSTGSLSVHCLATPGHTPGGFCYWVAHHEHHLCFVGDTVFAGSVGRSNPLSLYPTHLASLKNIVLRLPNTTILLPGHGPASTVEEERKHNPFA
ncbi:MAG: MBL fold metallo-hydrolase [Nitrospirae bacterium]|nr:MAG: MBL fold metallo-hydrolase [Nitrospirota bacterium]